MTTEIDGLVNAVRKAQAKLSVALEGITEEQLRKPPADGEWSVAQVLGHVIEMQPLWMEKAKLIASQDNPDVRRTPQEHEQRLQAVAKAELTPWSELQRRLDEAGTRALGMLRQMFPHDLDCVGHRSAGQTTTVRQMVESNLVGHIVEHARQVEEARRSMH